MTIGRFTDAAALVVGGAHGIGRGCAVRLAAEGASVAVLDADLEAADQVIAGLAASGEQRHMAIPVDVTDGASVNGAVAHAAAALGGVDTLVHAAGGDSPHGNFEATDDEVWVRLVDLNLIGVVRVCRAAIPSLRASAKGPAIVTISSVNGLTPLGSEAYSTAKAGLASLTQNLAVSLAGDGIRVNAVAPGTIRTRVWEDQPGGADRMLPLYPLGRVGTSEDVAAAVAFLASSDASWITGHTLPVDGGLLLARPQV